jgi:hypothetical protein
VAEATRSHIATSLPNPDWRQGYGFQFWHSRHGYRGDGAFGQFMLILPEADAVVAITSQSPDLQGLLDAVWTHLLPALTAGPGPAADPGPVAPASRSLPGPAGDPLPEGLSPQTFRPGPGNELTGLHSVHLTSPSAGKPGEIRLVETGPALIAALGAPGAWTRTGPVATASAWAGGRLLVDVVFVETPHRLHLRLDPGTGLFQARW